MVLNPPPADDRIVVLRLWREAHDPRPRGRLLTGALEPGDPLIGTTAILNALQTVVQSFEEAATSEPVDRPTRD
jgi:hypothetical protein